ncbi:MAG: META domain-containing protein [Micromonosporaceae bacterium]
MKIRVVSMTLCLLLVACGQGGRPGPAGGGTVARIDGRTFLSIAVTENGAPRPLVAGTRISVGFEQGKINANAGCNHLGGEYSVDAATLVVPQLAMTDMACLPVERMAQDTWLADLLTGRPSIDLDGDTLVLARGSVELRMLDRKTVNPDRPLAGPRWRVESIITGEVASSAPQEVEAYFTFTADGQVSGNTGCNDFHGVYQAATETITFGQMGMTKKACQGAANRLEVAVTALFARGPVRFAIDADQLSLTRADGTGGLQLRAAA